MPGDRVRVKGVVVRGHRVASGSGGDARFPNGTIRPQLRFFHSHISDFEAFLGGPAFPGTINVMFAGSRIVPGRPDHEVGPVSWTEVFPPERFLISRCTFEHAGTPYPAFLYIPDPATKPDHHQPADIVELLARPVPGLGYGDPLWLTYRSDTFLISGR